MSNPGPEYHEMMEDLYRDHGLLPKKISWIHNLIRRAVKALRRAS